MGKSIEIHKSAEVKCYISTALEIGISKPKFATQEPKFLKSLQESLTFFPPVINFVLDFVAFVQASKDVSEEAYILDRFLVCLKP